MENFKIAIIGSGNVAWHLAPALENAGHTITEVYSRDIYRAEKIVSQLYSSESKDDLDFSESEAEIYIIAVSDHAIAGIADEIILPEESILAHTSGTMPLDILAYSSASYTAVMYPLQSFSKSRPLDFEDVPFLLESDDQTTLQKIKKLTKSLSPLQYIVNSKDRMALHVAAVFASNFTNHMIRISEEIMQRQGLDFEMLQPLIIEQISKTIDLGPQAAQTGPAVRGDLNTLDQHHQFLNYNEQLAEIYKRISQDIIDVN
ncbi:DUF2520 domain-containing protein [Echinicola jeungdonensis]|uniref:Rossmann-like and DUF2520 domain-containing protein n=1 Tax=Echinicola jeungdonensis TaxID=709343 RepID=A0ABV5J4V0_9BACT|nr:Rossmann-like and DUF2520 domain-containing protein [Echinicola jeungdonensis]MDN3668811.1 DUF2520 domain-containing protein [Echinicola jeungdonensis]